tara:strand:+ start:394 stop:606 length:213 start_codon:yes stop_codon:yes gene_type:complete
METCKEWKLELSKTQLKMLLRNVREQHSKAWNKRSPNWVLIKNVLGKGSTTAFNFCKEIGIEADSTEINY